MPEKVESARLKRIDLVVPNDRNELAVIAEKAQKLLGYSGAMVSRNVAGDLGRVLVDLDIKPYDTSRVLSYKEKKRKEAHAEAKAKYRGYYTVKSSWKLVPIKQFSGQIPDFILNKAIQVKEAFPEAEFFVDTLNVQKKRIPDPFLVVKHGTEKYWIEVWDEDEFEKENN